MPADPSKQLDLPESPVGTAAASSRQAPLPEPDPSAQPILLLGPQRDPYLGEVLSERGWGGRVAVINAGWQERESDDELLLETVGGNAVNLKIWQRMQAVWEADPELAAADRERRSLLEEMQELYLLALDHTISAIIDLAGHSPRHPSVQRNALADAERIMRDIDARHLQRVTSVHDAFWERWTPHARPAVAWARELISKDLADADVVVMTGGHVGVLVGALHLFNVAPRIHIPIVAWGAGAMALTEKVVLFNDRAVHGPTAAEVFSTGVGMIRGIIALPGARSRLNLADTRRMSLFARRFAPSSLVMLDQREDLLIERSTDLPPNARLIQTDGSVGRLATAPAGVLP